MLSGCKFRHRTKSFWNLGKLSAYGFVGADWIERDCFSHKKFVQNNSLTIKRVAKYAVYNPLHLHLFGKFSFFNFFWMYFKMCSFPMKWPVLPSVSSNIPLKGSRHSSLPISAIFCNSVFRLFTASHIYAKSSFSWWQ